VKEISSPFKGEVRRGMGATISGPSI